MTGVVKRRRQTRRRFSTLCLATAASACIKPERRAAQSNALQKAKRVSYEQPGWFYDGAHHDSDVLKAMEDRAARVDWGDAPVPAPQRWTEYGFLRLESQRAIRPTRSGLIVLSESASVGLVDTRCRKYRTLVDGVALVESSPSTTALAAVTVGQRTRLVSESLGLNVELPTPNIDPDLGGLASQGWAFSRFALVAYAAIRPTDHDPDPATGVVAFVIDRRDGPRVVAHAAAQLRSFWGATLRVRPHAQGFVLVGRHALQWQDWRFRCTASWHDSDDLLRHREPVALAVRGRATHVLYGGSELDLLTFPRPGATARITRLPFRATLESPLAWTTRSPPWRDSQAPTAPEAWTPLPGPDGRVALAPPGHIVCYDADGTLAWQFERRGSSPAVLLDDGILVEHDSALFVLDWSGTFRHVWTAPSPLTARPLFHDRSWYIASEEGLHRLR